MAVAATWYRGHMAKKTGAQLDREIAEVLSKPSGRQLSAAAKRANDQIYDLRE